MLYHVIVLTRFALFNFSPARHKRLKSIRLLNLNVFDPGLKVITGFIQRGIGVLMKTKFLLFFSITVTHVREQIEAKIEQEVKGKITSDF